MEGQQAVALGLVALAAAHLGRTLWRQWRARDGGCGGVCGRPAPRGVRPPPQAHPLISLAPPKKRRAEEQESSH